jgi:hypothetical protein
VLDFSIFSTFSVHFREIGGKQETRKKILALKSEKLTSGELP